MGYPLTEALAGFCCTIFQLTAISWLVIGALHAGIWYLFGAKPCPKDVLIFLVVVVIAGPIGAALAIAVFAIYLLIVLPFNGVYDWLWHLFKRTSAADRRKNVG